MDLYNTRFQYLERQKRFLAVSAIFIEMCERFNIKVENSDHSAHGATVYVNYITKH